MKDTDVTLDYEYALFTQEDPIKLLKSGASKLSIPKKFKIAPHIRRAEALVRKCEKFRNIILDETSLSNISLGYMFCSYFGEKIDKHQFLAIPRSITTDFIRYLSISEFRKDDKYMKKATSLVIAHSDSIDAFVKAFMSIRYAQGELDKLQSLK